MATEVRSIVCANVGQLKAFLRSLSDKMPIQFIIGEKLQLTVWRSDPEEKGPRMYLEMDEE